MSTHLTKSAYGGPERHRKKGGSNELDNSPGNYSFFFFSGETMGFLDWGTRYDLALKARKGYTIITTLADSWKERKTSIHLDGLDIRHKKKTLQKPFSCLPLVSIDPWVLLGSE